MTFAQSEAVTQRCSVRKVFLEILQNFVNFAKFLRTPLLQNKFGRLLLHSKWWWWDFFFMQSYLRTKTWMSWEHAAFLDLDITVEGIFAYKLFDKRDKFPFFIVRMPYLSNIIPSFLYYMVQYFQNSYEYLDVR